MLEWSTRDTKRAEAIRTRDDMEWPAELDSDCARALAADLLIMADEMDRHR